MSKRRFLASFALGTFLLACASTGSSPDTGSMGGDTQSMGGACTPGETFACYCSDGAESTQSCLDDGSALGDCQCGALPIGGSGNVGTGNTGNVGTGNTGNVPTGGTGNVPTGGTGNAPTGGTGNVPTGGTGNAGGTGNVGTGNTGNVGSGGAAPGCSGRAGALRGHSTQTVTAAGVPRTFVYYAPPSLPADQPAPLVIVPHGWTMSGQVMYDITSYKAIADRENIVVVYPDGNAGNPWNCGSGICGAGAGVNNPTSNDQAFIDEIINFVDQDQCLDRNHVFVSGFSMGGYFSNEVGCVRSDIAAVGPHSGGSHDLSACPGSIKPVILFHFENDGLISYSCATEARDRWVQRNGCQPTASDVRPVNSGTCEYYDGCPAGAQVALCHFTGGVGPLIGGHGWAGGTSGGYAVPNAEDAAELGWGFFKEFAW